jgi:hypothetical protein
VKAIDFYLIDADCMF